MDIEMMSCEEMKKEIIRIIQEIENVEFLEEIYHFVKKLLKMEQAEEQRKGSRCMYELQGENHQAAGKV